MIRWIFRFAVLGNLLSFASCGVDVAGGTSEHENVLNSKQDLELLDSISCYQVEAGRCRDIGLVVAVFYTKSGEMSSRAYFILSVFVFGVTMGLASSEAGRCQTIRRLSPSFRG